MDASLVSGLIGSLGFPIVACCAMGWYVVKTNHAHLSQIQELNKQHYEEMKAMVSAVDNNTAAIQQLTQLIQSRDDVGGYLDEDSKAW